jgi:replication factor C small subunit
LVENIPIWRIKYLPKTLDEVCGRSIVKNRLKEYIKSENFPHLLLLGSEGIGKTTIANLFCQEFLRSFYEPNFQIVYADVPLTSDERDKARSEAHYSTGKLGRMAGKTITTPAFIQVKIKPFVRIKALGDVPFKILIVKNFEVLGSNQQGFRRLMESYGSNCRMILISHNVSGIIDPIKSRCQLIMIPPVDIKDFNTLITKVAKSENLMIDNGTIEHLYKITNGKIAKAIDLLQITSISDNTISVDNLYENSMVFQNDLIRSLLLMTLKGQFNKARDLSRKIQSNYKYTVQELFLLLYNELIKLPLGTYALSNLINMMADADFRAIDGRDSDIQISNLLSKLCYYSEFL